MNYIWDVLLRAKQQGISPEKIRFILAKHYSPYMEISFEDLNTKKLEELEVEINPYYRFYSIFKDLFHIDFKEELELREVLLDVLMHYLASIDLKQGLCKSEYYRKFIANDLQSGIYGQRIAHVFKTMPYAEKNALLDGILMLYKTGVSQLIFRKIMGAIFKRSYIYQNQDAKDELLIYIGERKSEINKNKLQMICEIFLPLHTRLSIYWEYHFCIMEVPETSILDEIALY